MSTALNEAAQAVARHFAVVESVAFAEDGHAVRARSSADALVELERRIYRRCHLHASRLPDGDAVADELLREKLRTRIGSRLSEQDGWVLVERAGDRARVRKEGLTLSVTARELRAPPRVAPGDAVSVLFPAGRPRALPGWFVYVARDGQPDASAGLWRVYVNVRGEHAAAAVGRLSCWLEARRARFQLKLLDGSRIGSRPDALVAFTGVADLEAAVRCAVRMGKAGWLDAATPGFAEPVAPGVAIAPEPADGRSYGQACAHAAAVGSFDAWRNGAESPEERAAIVAESLERAIAAAPLPLDGEPT